MELRRPPADSPYLGGRSELKIRDNRVVVAGGRGHDLVANAADQRVVKNVVEHIGTATPCDLAILNRAESTTGKLRDQRVVFAHVEIARENRRAARRSQMLRDEVALKGVCRAARPKHEEREQVRV